MNKSWNTDPSALPVIQSGPRQFMQSSVLCVAMIYEEVQPLQSPPAPEDTLANNFLIILSQSLVVVQDITRAGVDLVRCESNKQSLLKWVQTQNARERQLETSGFS